MGLFHSLTALDLFLGQGIVPGSATVFVLDEAQGLGRLDLTLLEGVMIVVEVNSQGYKVRLSNHTLRRSLLAPILSIY